MPDNFKKSINLEKLERKEVKLDSADSPWWCWNNPEIAEVC